jgi:uncharacterized membrane protein YbhN (UPF0104 family)
MVMTDSRLQSRSMRGRIKLIARAALSGAALAWALHKTPLHAITTALGHADLPLFMIGLVLNFLARLAAAERTLVISRGLGLWISRWQTIETLFISNFYALLSPGPVLSGVVTVYRYRGYGASMTASVGSLLASRAIECLLFVALGAACVLIDPRISLASVRYPLTLAGMTLVAAAIAVALWWGQHRGWRWTSAPARSQPQRMVTELARADTTGPASTPVRRGLLTEVRAVRDEIMHRGPAMAFQAMAPACLQVILSSAAVAVQARALGMDLSLLSAIWINAAVYAVVLLPISVAGVGVREVTLTSALAMLGFDPGLAVALSILMFLDPLINAMLGGVLQLRSTLTRVQRQV